MAASMGDFLHTHLWSENSRQFTQDGRVISLRQCARCRRDFALGLDGASWDAVYLGVFKVVLLAKEVSSRWLREPCPKEPRHKTTLIAGCLVVQIKTVAI